MATGTKAKKAKKSKSKSRTLPNCSAADLRKAKAKRRPCVAPTVIRASPSGPVAAPPTANPSPDAFPTGTAVGTVSTIVPPAHVQPDSASPVDPTPPADPVPSPSPQPQPTDQPVPTPNDPASDAALAAAQASGLPTFRGTFDVTMATRLLYRAGFGPKPGQAEQLAQLGLTSAVNRLVNAGPAVLEGPAPSGTWLVNGALAPTSKWGHLHLECLDRAVRSTDSLGERMALILHDWFPVSEVSVDVVHIYNMINNLRANWRGSFRTTLMNVASEPAMLWFLSGWSNRKGAPNENFGRELMELFTLGADRGAYTETDVREMARAFTGFTMDWNSTERAHNFRFDASRHDAGTKTVFAGTSYAVTGALSWQDGINAVVNHPLHPSFVVRKLWSYFIPTQPSAATQSALEALYRSAGERLDTLVKAILLHPDLYAGPTMAKNPMVYTAGLMRARALPMTTNSWAYQGSFAGQLVGRPPSIAGWNDLAWINTGTYAARWTLARWVNQTALATANEYLSKLTETPAQAVAAALAFWGNPPITTDVQLALNRVAAQTWTRGQVGDTYWTLQSFLANRQNALRQLIVSSPDFQVS